MSHTLSPKRVRVSNNKESRHMEHSRSLPAHHYRSKMHLDNDKSAFSDTLKKPQRKKRASNCHRPQKLGAQRLLQGLQEDSSFYEIDKKNRKNTETEINRRRCIFLDREPIENILEKEHTEEIVEKPRKIIFDRNCSEYLS